MSNDVTADDFITESHWQYWVRLSISQFIKNMKDVPAY